MTFIVITGNKVIIAENVKFDGLTIYLRYVVAISMVKKITSLFSGRGFLGGFIEFYIWRPELKPIAFRVVNVNNSRPPSMIFYRCWIKSYFVQV